SERAFFEYLPIDVGGPASGAFDPGAAPVYPDERIYRALDFGALLRLVLTDYRSFRPDHVVPEDAYPGTVFLTAGDYATEAAAGRLPAGLDLGTQAHAAVDIDAPALATANAALLAAAMDEAGKAGVDPAEVPARGA